jgi:hypothetical protein
LSNLTDSQHYFRHHHHHSISWREKSKAKQSKAKQRKEGRERERKRDDLAYWVCQPLTDSKLTQSIQVMYESQLPNFLLSSTQIHLHLLTWEASVCLYLGLFIYSFICIYIFFWVGQFWWCCQKLEMIPQEDLAK